MALVKYEDENRKEQKWRGWDTIHSLNVKTSNQVGSLANSLTFLLATMVQKLETCNIISMLPTHVSNQYSITWASIE